MRLDRFLSNSGFGTRTEVRTAIRNKRVHVNNVLVNNSSFQIDPNNDNVLIDNKLVKYKEFVYFVLNKPKGYISANTDLKHKTILDFFKNVPKKNLSHVGRLDIDTTGVIIITNDGNLGHKLISPKYNVEKIYELTVDKPLNNEISQIVESGIILENGEKCKPAKIEILSDFKAKLYLTEGKYHQVKRMMASMGYKVVDLNRVMFAGLTTQGVDQGEYYELTEEQVKNLKKLVD